MSKFYDHKTLEEKWNKRWNNEKLYEVDPADATNKFYCVDMFPYPSGEGLHVGHWRGYVLSDFYARYWRLMGKTVLHPMGFDAFGLPAENAAIQNKTHPTEFTSQTIKTFTRQLQQIGASYDWTKTINTSDPSFYRWTQWLFVQLFEKGFAEKRNGLVNWCPKDQTVLANEQVVDGKCERCGSDVTKKELSQWYVKTTELAEELHAGLDDVNWPEHVKTLQRNWIGKSSGARVKFVTENNFDIEVFTTRPDTIFGVTAVVVSPNHPYLVQDGSIAESEKAKVEEYLKSVAAKTNIDRQQQKESDKTAVFTGTSAIHPITKEKLPIWIADYVLAEYGTGAIMCVPAHDERDFQFATTHQLPIKQVIAEKLTQTVEPGIYRPGEPTVEKDGVIVFVKHWSEEKYLGLKWKTVDWGTLLTGGVDDEMTPEDTALKEIREETGYLNAKIVNKLCVVDGLFYHVPKEVNRLVHGHVFVVQLSDDSKEEISDEEASRHDLLWLTTEELESFLTPDTHKYALKVLRDGFRPHSGNGTLVNSAQFTGRSSQESREEMVKAANGSEETVYRLRDWLVSRQRYWGAPIPVVYDPEGKPHAVKSEHLPLQLPTDVDFLPGGESPLARSKEYVECAEKLYGKGWRFETDTLDTFVDSSWYFLRYLTPNDDKQPFDEKLVNDWLPVDLYIGGIEHATLHLLYARFVTRFLAKFGYIDQSVQEPFSQLFNIGMINMNGVKMSKSKGNIVSPDPLIEHYGTDALRGYELFVGPMDIEAEWSVNGINGIHRFLIKLNNVAESVIDGNSSNTSTDISTKFASYLAEINRMIGEFRLNTVISEAMKFLNSSAGEQGGLNVPTLKQFLITLSPIFPYLCEELWQKCGEKDSIFKASWPVVELAESAVSLSVRVNHKHVESVEVTGQEKEEEIKGLITDERLVQKLAESKPTRVIYRAGLFVDYIF